jgi:(4S)-4-hydroxy-5-phosphonooxypentane-2,3-dione isomerase
MMSYAITVEFILKSGCMAAFRKLIDQNAQNSLDLEPGCRRFDVLVPLNKPNTVFLYEIYDDKAAFEAHLKSAHFLTFNQKSSSLVHSKSVVDYALAYEASRAK